jgi:hypothetical protein
LLTERVGILSTTVVVSDNSERTLGHLVRGKPRLDERTSPLPSDELMNQSPILDAPRCQLTLKQFSESALVSRYDDLASLSEMPTEVCKT